MLLRYDVFLNTVANVDRTVSDDLSPKEISVTNSSDTATTGYKIVSTSQINYHHSHHYTNRSSSSRSHRCYHT